MRRKLHVCAGMSCKARRRMAVGSMLTSYFWSGETWRYEGVGENRSIH